jgi:hypothetical protein
MTTLPKNIDLKTAIFQFMDVHGIAYKYKSCISINVDLMEEFDEIERLIKGIYSVEDASNFDNWQKNTQIEFITPVMFLSQFNLYNGDEYQELVNEYIMSTYELNSSKNLKEETQKIGILNITSYHGDFLSQSKLHTDIWGFHLKGILTFPRKNIIGDISVSNSYLHEAIESVDGNVNINSEINGFNNLTKILGNLNFSNNITQNRILSSTPLKIINGNCNLKRTRMNLDTIDFIGGDLNIRKCAIRSINNKLTVEGNLLISKYNYNLIEELLSEITILGKIKKYSDPFDIRFEDDKWLENLIDNL